MTAEHLKTNNIQIVLTQHGPKRTEEDIKRQPQLNYDKGKEDGNKYEDSLFSTVPN